MSAEKILDKASFLKGVEVGRAIGRWIGSATEPQPEPVSGPFQMKVDMQRYGVKRFMADMRGTFEIDWGDGSSQTITNNGTSGVRHDYAALGQYTISIDGELQYLGQGSWSYNGLTAVVELLTPLPASLRTLYYAFSECSGLTSIPADLFTRCANLKTVTGCFSKTPVTTIPAGLFSGCPNAVNFESCFSNCKSLTGIPAGLFDNCGKVTTFNNCFLGCTSITEIPAGLFDSCPDAETFVSCFKSCSSLEDIPGGLFQNQAKADRFTSCFGWCGALVTVPEDLFAGCVAATQFDSCFQSCQSLESVPEGLFAECSLVTRFSSCFSGCTSLSEVPEGIFDNNPAVTQLNECFLRCLQLTHAPALWTSFPNATHTKCFTNCNNADNYEDIPSDWK